MLLGCLAVGHASAVAPKLSANEIEVDFVQIDIAEIGLAGIQKLGYWTPVRIAISGGTENATARLELQTVDGEGLAVIYSDESAIVIEARQELTVTRYIKTGRKDAPLVVRLMDIESSKLMAEAVTTMESNPSSVTTVLQFGADVGVERLEAYGSRNPANRVIGGRVADASKLPDSHLGYDGVRTILMTTGNMDWFESMSDQQHQAIDQWVASGGHLVISAGDQAAKVFSADGPLSNWSPGHVTEIRSSFETSGLQTYTKAAQSLSVRMPVPFAVVENPRGRILAHEGGGGLGDRPLLIDRAYGLGRVSILLVDLERSPLADWLAMPRVLARLTGIMTEDPSNHSRTDSARLAATNYSDLIGQLRGALDQFSNVVLVHFSWIAALIVLFVLLIGPADYFGLTALKKWHWTWLTFPTIVLIFSVLAVVLSRGVKGRQIRLNEVHVVDIDVGEKQVRGTYWAHLYSPQLGQWDLQMRCRKEPLKGIEIQQNLLTWQGLPGSRIGAMRGPTGMVIQASAYRVTMGSDEGQIEDLPVTVASTKSLISQWNGKLTDDWGSLANLKLNVNGLLKGEFTNPLSVPLSRASLVYRGWIFRIPMTIGPGERVSIDHLSPLDVTWQLTRRRVLKSHDASLPWSPEDVSDLPRIVEMLMFYGVAGGENYTQLAHQYQRFIDLSSQLQLNRAILVGYCAEPLSELIVNNGEAKPTTDQQLQIVRILWPVHPANEASRD